MASFADLLPGSTIQQYLLLAAVVLFALTMFRIRRKYGQRRQRDSQPSNKVLEQMLAQTRVHDAATAAEVKLFESFRQMSGQLDTKIHVLNELLIQADSRIADLRQLHAVRSGESNPSSATNPASSRLGEKAETTLPVELAPTADASSLGHSAGPPRLEALDRPIETDPRGPEESAEDPLVIEPDRFTAHLKASHQSSSTADRVANGSATNSVADRFAEIYALADEGWTSTRISERVGRSLGEVELLLSLRRRRQRSAAHTNDRSSTPFPTV